MRKYIDIVESQSAPILEYDPSEQAYVFTGYDVRAVMMGTPEKGVLIYEFSSQSAGSGNGERALRWLQANYASIEVSDPGEPGTPSRAFWDRMCDKGLVDAMEDDANNVIYRKLDEDAAQLPMDKQSRMARAKQLGYTVPAYHGTAAKFNEFRFEGGRGGAASGFAPHFTDKKKEARGYATKRRAESGENAYVMDVLLRMRKPLLVPNMFGKWEAGANERISPELFAIIAGSPPEKDARLIFHDATYQAWNHARKNGIDRTQMWSQIYARLKKAGYDAIVFKDTPGDHIDGKYDKIVMLDMSGIRLTSAAFDPSRTHDVDLRA